MSWDRQAYSVAELETSDITPPLHLIKALQNTEISDDHEALLCLLNVLTEEADFIPGSSFKEWKKKYYYTIAYTHPTTHNLQCHIKYLPMGTSAMVFATVENKGVCKLSLELSSYIEDVTQKEPHKLFKNLPYLSRTYKNMIVWKMLAYLQDFANVGQTLGLSCLAPEVKLEILNKMDVASLVSLASVNREFHDLIELDSNWQLILFRDFPKHQGETSGNWKELYKIEYKAKVKAQKLRKEEEKKQREEQRRKSQFSNRSWMSHRGFTHEFDPFHGTHSGFSGLRLPLFDPRREHAPKRRFLNVNPNMF